LGVAHLVGGA